MLDLHHLTPRQQQILDEIRLEYPESDSAAGDALMAHLQGIADQQRREGERMNAWHRRFMRGEVEVIDESDPAYVDPRVEACREAGVQPFGEL